MLRCRTLQNALFDALCASVGLYLFWPSFALPKRTSDLRRDVCGLLNAFVKTTRQHTAQHNITQHGITTRGPNVCACVDVIGLTFLSMDGMAAGLRHDAPPTAALGGKKNQLNIRSGAPHW